jgi:hypothetical protein
MQEYDVALKLLLRSSAGIAMRELTGVAVETWLDVELPRVQNRRVDLLGETADRSLIHMELQSTNEAAMPLRMAEYCLSIFRLHGKFPRQIMLYAALLAGRICPAPGSANLTTAIADQCALARDCQPPLPHRLRQHSRRTPDVRSNGDGGDPRTRTRGSQSTTRFPVPVTDEAGIRTHRFVQEFSSRVLVFEEYITAWETKAGQPNRRSRRRPTFQAIACNVRFLNRN